MAIKQNLHGFNSILVDADALGQQHPALDAALNLAEHFHATVKIVDVIWDVPPGARSFVTPRLEREILENHREHLVRLACWRQRPMPVETAILRGAPGVALVQEVLRHGHDLLVRAHGRDLPDEAPLFGPERTARDGVAALVERFGERLTDVRVDVVKGDPADVIPAIAFEKQADSIVMGSMGRSGLAGIFMGNTAERVLSSWQGSVFVVKPLGFVSPVVLDPETEHNVLSA